MPRFWSKKGFDQVYDLNSAVVPMSRPTETGIHINTYANTALMRRNTKKKD